jgi:hypothetical protein
MNRELVILLLGIVIIISALVGISHTVSSSKETENKKLAQKLFDFENTVYPCNKLVKLYLKSEKVRYDSWNDLSWAVAVEDKFIDTGCITQTELNNLEFVKMCMDSTQLRCELSKLKNPELYKNFDYLKELNLLINSNSTKQSFTSVEVVN